MASVHVLVGQCGNQLGKTFLDGLVDDVQGGGDDDVAAQVSGMHFRPSRSPLPHPRCVMIDMEPKVIASALHRTDTAGSYTLQPPQYITRHSGSANNWAYGYHTHGNRYRSTITEALRRESEASGAVRTFHVMHSAAGGTGSGVGCCVADIVRLEFPRALLLHTVVWPFASGEVVTQWYNSVMTMSTLRETTDAVFIAHNDDFINRMAVGRRGVLGCAGSEEVSFESMNKDITQLLLDLHLPRRVYRLHRDASSTSCSASDDRKAYRASQRVGIAAEISHSHLHNTHTSCGNSHAPVVVPLRRGDISDVVESIALDPALKFFSGVAIPSSNGNNNNNNNNNNSESSGAPGNRNRNPYNNSISGMRSHTVSWQSVMREAARRSFELCTTITTTNSTGIGGSHNNPYCVNRPCLWNLRGVGACSEGLTELCNICTFTSPSSSSCAHSSPISTIPPTCVNVCGGMGIGGPRVSLFAPSPIVGVRLRNCLRKTERLLSVNAFTQHFESHGVGADDIRDAVVRLWDTVAAYTPEEKEEE